ncbi:OmpA family protein [Candidatus Halobeggiatoa sp. HSG11]|nr:OmpA family protein [Candidatus Halobeggiatoa sp. HSG11]
MSDYYGRKILVGIVAGTLLSTAVASVLAANDDDDTYRLIDSQGKPVLTKRENECVLTPRSPNTPSTLFQECGDSMDQDGDGINDDEDKCPNNTAEEISKGVYQDGPNKGCPIDSDNDGVPDYRDDCPNNTPMEIDRGVNDRGCPVDSDRDGVPDYKDKCPDTPLGYAVDENGCHDICEAQPEKCPAPVPVSVDADVLFKFDKYNLTSNGKSVIASIVDGIGSLDNVSMVTVVGHTDSTGKKRYNQKLSERRAASVVNYMISIGIPEDKISAKGDGELNPIASNSTRAGRAQNRRVEISVERN